MKRYILALLIFLMMFVIAACEGVGSTDRASTITTTKPIVIACFPGGIPISNSSLVPLRSQSLEALIETRKNINLGNDRYGLLRLECYAPVSAEKLLKLNGIEVHYTETRYIDNKNLIYQGSTQFSYNIAGSDSVGLTLEFSRAHNYMPEAMLQDWIKNAGLKPLEGVDGVYCSGVNNPWDNGELSFTEFAWVYDGVRFRMEVYPWAMERILANDPEALKGSLFELVKIDMDTGEPIAAPPPTDNSSAASSLPAAAPTPPPAADTVPSTPGGDVPSVPDPVTPPDALPTAVNPPSSADTPTTP